MASDTASIAGFATPATIAHYENLARSKAGLVMVEYTYVHPSGRSEENQLGVSSDDHVEGLSQIAKTIHQSGALAGIQLTHAGGKTSRDLTGGVLMGPADIAVPVKDEVMEKPTPMTQAEIALWKASFVLAAIRAQKSGFDLVELHAAHGYGLNQWLSPITNTRKDAYGGSLEKNSRLLFEIIEAIRAKLPEILIAVRMPGQDFLEGGLTSEETAWIAKELERLGVDVLDVSSGIGGWRRPRDRNGEGYLVSEASKIQNAVTIPVIGVGGIKTAAFIDELVATNAVSLVAVGRAILEDPSGWGMNCGRSA